MSAKGIMTCLVVCLLGASAEVASAEGLTPMEMLGKHLFFDENLSTPPGQSCAACHAQEVGFTGPISEVNAHGAVYEGAVFNRFGNRKPPAASYAGDSPVLFYDAVEDVWIGGVFWDGRATGWTLGDPLSEQAQGPFLNPLEQNNPTAKRVCKKVAKSDYADLYEAVFGEPVDYVHDIAQTYENLVRAISAYEKSTEVNPFSSKYDYYLAGMVDLTAQEALGLMLFEAEDKGNCAACHPSRPAQDGSPPLFTDFTYDNLGVPPNPENPFYLLPARLNPDGFAFVDLGLGAVVKDPAQNGKFRVPTLRNVAVTSPYMHNGVFKTLFQVLAFYNTRDVARWPAPEVGQNVNREELGTLRLTNQELEDVVAFLQTLTDGWRPASSR